MSFSNQKFDCFPFIYRHLFKWLEFVTIFWQALLGSPWPDSHESGFDQALHLLLAGTNALRKKIPVYVIWQQNYIHGHLFQMFNWSHFIMLQNVLAQWISWPAPFFCQVLLMQMVSCGWSCGGCYIIAETLKMLWTLWFKVGQLPGVKEGRINR